MVSLDFIPQEYREKVIVSLNDDKGRYGEVSAQVSCDVTSYIQTLPEYITKVVVDMPDICIVCDDDFLDFEKKSILCFLDNLLGEDSRLSSGHIYADAATVTMTLKGGYEIRAWNSEWGAVEISKVEGD